jgi:hypothetical protein
MDWVTFMLLMWRHQPPYKRLPTGILHKDFLEGGRPRPKRQVGEDAKKALGPSLLPPHYTPLMTAGKCDDNLSTEGRIGD